MVGDIKKAVFINNEPHWEVSSEDFPMLYYLDDVDNYDFGIMGKFKRIIECKSTDLDTHVKHLVVVKLQIYYGEAIVCLLEGKFYELLQDGSDNPPRMNDITHLVYSVADLI